MSVRLTRDEVREAYKSFFALKKKGLTQHVFSLLKYVQSVFKVEGDRVTLSLGTNRGDGVRGVSFRISQGPDIKYERVRELSIIYEKNSGQIEARLVVEVKACENNGTMKAKVWVTLH